MEHLLGITGLAFVGLVTLYLALRYPAIRIVLLAAFLLRAGAALFQFYVAPLPDGTADAISFERTAWAWASGGLTGVFEQYCGPHSYFISFIIGIVYAITDRSPLLAQSLSVLLGMGTVLLSWKLAGEIWGGRAALKAAWVTALFPTLILYSALTMREAYIWFFLMLALLGVLRWARKGGLKPAIFALLGFVGATFFHGGMIVGALAFLGLIGLRALNLLLISMSRGKIRVISAGVIACTALLLAGYAASDVRIPKLGTFQQAIDTERMSAIFAKATRDTAAYPKWIVPESLQELIYKAPIRAGYFLFSPFPWDISKPRHLIGLFDGLLYLGLVFLLWRNREMIWSDPGARSLLIVLIAFILVFGIAVGNFGTGLRHRAKFVAVLIVLGAPKLPELLFRTRMPTGVLK